MAMIFRIYERNQDLNINHIKIIISKIMVKIMV